MLPVDVIGVNEPGQAQNSLMFNGKPLSWVRDNAQINVKLAWGVNYRDTIILNPLNGKVEVYNLSTYNLTVPANKAALKAKLVAAATPVDSDNDGLPDYWETLAYSGLERMPVPGLKGGPAPLLEYAHCSPLPPAGGLPGGPQWVRVQDEKNQWVMALRWTQRRGTAFGLTFTPEFSSDLGMWISEGHGYQRWSVHPLYDGSGGEVVEWRPLVSAPAPVPVSMFTRVKVSSSR